MTTNVTFSPDKKLIS